MPAILISVASFAATKDGRRLVAKAVFGIAVYIGFVVEHDPHPMQSTINAFSSITM